MDDMAESSMMASQADMGDMGDGSAVASMSMMDNSASMGNNGCAMPCMTPVSIPIPVTTVKWSTSYVNKDALMWTILVLAFLMALVALVLVIIVYLRERNDHRKLKRLTCESKECCCRLTRQVRALRASGQTVLGHFSWTEATLTGTVPQQAMLLVAATPFPGAPLSDAQPAGSSLIPAPFAGTLTALTIEASSVPTGGSANFVATVNGVNSVLTATLESTATSPFVSAVAATPIPFNAGDLIGVAFSTTTYATTVTPPTLTAQLFANFSQL
jgi:hypothetical protein